MKFKVETDIPDFKQKISYSDRLFLVGSCFSAEMASKFEFAGFNTLSNPYGTIFHPIPLANNLRTIMELNSDFPVLEYEQKLYYLNASMQAPTTNRSEYLTILSAQQRQLHTQLKNATHLFVTFGTAWGYREKSSQRLVANCHKLPASLFVKELTTMDEMHQIWKETLASVYQFNPAIQVVVTLSPVRHIKDGLVANNRSKARLFELISQLEQDFPVTYFPSYELVMDELRDYRFFKEDLVHPNTQAIQFVWNKIKETMIEETTKKIMEELEQLRKLAQHQPVSPNKFEITAFEQNRKTKIAAFLQKHPEVNW